MSREDGFPAWVTAAILAGVYLLVDPHTGDHAAAVYRAGLFERQGFSLWDNNWYSGHHIPAYSVLYPPLASLVGVRLAGALAAVAAAAAFERLTDNLRPGFHSPGECPGECPGSNRIATHWFALGTATLLITGRLPFLLGVAFAVGALVALRHRHLWIAVPLALACGLSSPVAGFFLALVAVVLVIEPERRAVAIATTGAALAPAVILSAAFPEGGSFPFAPSSFWPQLAGTLLVLFLIVRQRSFQQLKSNPLAVGTVLYALVLIGAFFVASPMGGNAVRLGALAAGPVAAIVLLPQRRWWLAAAAVPLLFWQLNAPLDNYLRTRGDESVNESYYSELNAELAKRTVRRLEIPFTENHWETAYVADKTPLARGWERQLDRKDNRLFYAGGLDGAKYAAWLDSNAVNYVAVPDAPLDYSAKAEAKVIAAGVPGLKQVWAGRHWKLYEVRSPRPLVQGGRLVRATADEVVIDVPAAASVRLALNWTPYWDLAQGDGCVHKWGDRTAIDVRRPGRVRLVTKFSLGRVRKTSARCS